MLNRVVFIAGRWLNPGLAGCGRCVVFFAAVLANLCLLAPDLARANPGPNGFNIQGTLYGPSGAAHEGLVAFKVQILDAGAACVLYQETHNLDLTTTKGVFSIDLGQGTSRSNKVDSSTSLASNVFRNDVNIPSSVDCAPGVTFTSGAARLVRVLYDVGSGETAMSPDLTLRGSPYSAVAETLQGKSPSQFLQPNSANALTQLNLETIFAGGNFAKLTNLLAGNSTDYVSRVVTTPTTGTDAANKTYVDGTIAGRAADGALTGLAAGDAGKVLSWDGTKWVAQTAAVGGTGTVTSVQIALPSFLTVSGGPITNSGTISASLASQSAGSVFAAPSGSAGTPSFRSLLASDIPTLDGSKVSGGTIGGSTSITTSGNVSAANLSSRGLSVWDSDNTNNVLIQAPATASLTSNYVLTLPTTAGTTGQVLTTTGSGTLSWTTPSSGGSGDVTIGGNTVASTMTIGTNSAQRLDFETNGTTAVSIGTNGSVGIGTTNPQAALDVNGAIRIGNDATACSATNVGSLRFTGTAVQYCVANTWVPFNGSQWTTNGSAVGYAGPVGIGTTSPLGYELHIADSGTSTQIKMTNNTGATASDGADIELLNSNVILRNNENGRMDFVNGTSQITMLNGGNIGVGTTNPATALDIAGTVNASGAYWVGGSSVLGKSGSKVVVGDVGSNALTLSLLSNGSERMYIDPSGNVGIGTTAPAAPLEVNGAIKIGTGTCGASTQGSLQFSGGNIQYCNTSNVWTTLGAGGSGDVIRGGNTQISGTMVVGTNDEFPLALETANTTRLRFATDGSATFYSHPTSGSSPSLSLNHQTAKLSAAQYYHNTVELESPHIYGSNSSHGSSIGVTAVPDNSIGANLLSIAATRAANLAYLTPSNLYPGAFAVIRIDRDGGPSSSTSTPGQLLFQTTASGTTIPTSRLVIRADGTIGVGTTNPVTLLDVNGSIKIGTGTCGASTQGSLQFSGGNIQYCNTSNVWTTLGGGGSGDVLRGGNTQSSGTMVVGTNDAFPLAFETNGTTQVTITSAGSVGIGTTNPSSGKLQVVTSSGSGDVIAVQDTGASGFSEITYLDSDGTNGGWIGHDNANDRMFINSGSARSVSIATHGGTSERLRIDGATGNVGVGTNGPSAKFSVGGLAADNAYFFFDNADVSDTADGQSLYVHRRAAEGDDYLRFHTDQIRQQWISSTNNLVIDVPNGFSPYIRTSWASTYAPLDTGRWAPDLATTWFSNTSTGDSTGAQVSFLTYNTAGTQQAAFIGAVANATGSAPTLVFSQQTGATAYNERMRIDAAGNLGVGTTNPATKLDVNGSIKLGTGTCAAATQGSLQFSGGVIQYCNTSNVWTTLGGGGSGDVVNGGNTQSSGTMVVGTNDAFPLALETNGTNRMIIDASGNAAFGGAPTTNFTLALRRGAVGYAGISMYNPMAVSGFDIGLDQNNANALIWNGNPGSIQFATNSARRMTITSGGDVGIGLTNPGTTLDVAGNVNASGAYWVGGGSVLGKSGSKIVVGDVGSNALTLSLLTNGSERMYIDPSGNVGIGTTNPTNKLVVQGLTTLNGDTTIGGTLYSGSRALIGDGTAALPGYGFFNGTATGMYRAGTDLLGFSTAGSERLRIGATGNIGIGTTAPATTLDVNGSIKLGTGTCAAATQGSLQFSGGNIQYCNTSNVWTTLSASSLTYPLLASPAVTTATNPSYSFTGDTQTGIYSVGTGTVAFASGGVNVMRVSQDGVSTVGNFRASASSLGVPGHPFEVISGAGDLVYDVFGDLTMNAAGPGARFIFENPDTSSGVNIGEVSFEAGASIQALRTQNWFASNRGTRMLFNVTPTGSATKATALALDSTGNVGIGTTAPATKLDVNGSIKLGTGTCAAATQGSLQFSGGNIQYCNTSNVWTTLGGGGSGDVVNGGNTVASTMVVGTNSVHNLGFETSGTTRMMINTAGAVSIGLTAPATNSMLTVHGNTDTDAMGPLTIKGTASSTYGTGLTFDGSSITGGATWALYTGGPSSASGTGKFNIWNAELGENVLTISSTSNFIGINQNHNPAYPLDVMVDSSSQAVAMRLQNNEIAANNNGVELYFGANRTTGGMTNVAAVSGQITDITNGAYKGALILSTANNALPAERMRILSSGNVGIGLTNPATTLDVNGSIKLGTGTCAAATQGSLQFSGGNIQYCNTSNVWTTLGGGGSGDVVNGGNTVSGTMTIGTNSAHGLGLETGGNTRLFITSAGSIAIGSTVPAQSSLLTVEGAQDSGGFGPLTVRAPATSPGGTGITLDGTLMTNGKAWSIYTGGSSSVSGVGKLGIWNEDLVENALVIDSTNNHIGIGSNINNPGYPLDVSNDGAMTVTPARLRNNDPASVNNGAMLAFGANRTTGGMTDVAAIGGAITDITNGTYKGALVLSTADGAAPTERMRILHSGNVGIGTTNPATALHVNGAVKLGTGTCAAATQGSLQFSGGNIQFCNTSNVWTTLAAGGSGDVVRGGNTQASGTMVVGTNDAFPLAFETNGTTRVTVTSAGAMGIGSISPTNMLDVVKDQNTTTAVLISNSSNTASAETALYLKNDGGNNSYLGLVSSSHSNAVFANRVSLGASTSHNGVNIISESGSGDFRVYTGGAVASNERLRILSSGNVGIGTTNPLAPLHVATATGDSTLNSENFRLVSNSTAGGGPAVTMARPTSQTVSGTVGKVRFASGTAGSQTQRASVEAITTENWGTNFGTRLDFTTTPNGTTNTAIAMTIDHDGEVGIGTTNPAATLDVYGIVKLGTGTCGATTQGSLQFTSNQIQYCNTSNTWTALSTGSATAAGSTGDIQINSSNALSSGSFRFSTANNTLGIGGTVGYSSANNAMSLYRSTGADYYIQMHANGTGANSGDGTLFGVNGTNTVLSNQEAGNILLSTNGSERLRVAANGYVGIGITSPTSPLTVEAVSTGTSSYPVANAYNYINAAGPSAGQYSAMGADLYVQSTSAALTGALTSTYGYFENNSPAGVATGRAVYGGAWNNSSGTVGKAAGAEFEAGNALSTGTITNAYGATFGITRTAGTIQNGIGISIGNIQATNKYAIHSSDSTARVYIAGSVGIGTTGPATALDVNGSIKLGTGTCAAATQGSLQFSGGNIQYCNTSNVWTNLSGGGSGDVVRGGNTQGSGVMVVGTNDAYPLAFEVGNTTRMTFATNGYIGVGTTAPTTWMHVSGTASTGDGILVENLSSNSNAETQIQLGTDSGVLGHLWMGSSAFYDAPRRNRLLLSGDGVGLGFEATSATGDMRFAIGGSVTTSEKMRIDSVGVGIGTTQPRTKLDVNGSIKLGTGTCGANTQGSIQFSGGNIQYCNTSNVWTTLVSGTTGDVTRGGNTQSSGTMVIGTNDAFPLAFETNGTSRIHVDATGSVGIGSTSLSNKLQIGSNPEGWLGNDLVVSNASGGWYSSNNAVSTEFGANKRIDFRSNYTLTMSVQTGKVGIGTTAPAATLDVTGQIHTNVYNAGTSMSIDWNNGNNQYNAPTGNACGGITLSNLLDGGTYTLAVQGVTSGTCSFSQGSLVFVYNPANTAVASDAVYTFLRMGNKVYVSWVTGFQ